MISDTGYWTEQNEALSSKCDTGLCNELIKYINENNYKMTYDFGCGSGEYVKRFIAADIFTLGFDGNPQTETFGCIVQDLTEDDKEPAPVDFILCLEVGEHIPAKHENTFVNNLLKNLNNGGILVISWAVRGQGGYGHVNEKENIEVITDFENRGLCFSNGLTKRFKDSISDISYFKNTLMVFTK
tara:strand:- start:456 stop:1010 length:555 start_codon:yes stop_codon:yes gene_type:complete